MTRRVRRVGHVRGVSIGLLVILRPLLACNVPHITSLKWSQNFHTMPRSAFSRRSAVLWSAEKNCPLMCFRTGAPRPTRVVGRIPAKKSGQLSRSVGRLRAASLSVVSHDRSNSPSCSVLRTARRCGDSSVPQIQLSSVRQSQESIISADSACRHSMDWASMYSSCILTRIPIYRECEVQ